MTEEHKLSNLTKEDSIKFIEYILNNGILDHEDISDIREDLESALRVALAHLKAVSPDDKTLGNAVDAIFQMYKRDNNIDKSYRNAARFILSAVNDVPVRYEECEEDERLHSKN